MKTLELGLAAGLLMVAAQTITTHVATNGNPPIDSKTNKIDQMFIDRLTHEWVLYRKYEMQNNLAHHIPDDYIYGPTWSKINSQWRIHFDQMAVRDWDEGMKDPKYRKIAEEKYPPLDREGHPDDSYVGKLAESWTRYRMREHCDGIKHSPPANLNYGPEWQAMSMSWRNNFEKQSLDHWNVKEADGTVARINCAQARRNGIIP